MVSIGEITTEATAVGFKLKVRHAGAASSVTVRLTVDCGDGGSYDAAVTVPDSPATQTHPRSAERFTAASLLVPRSSHHQRIGVTVNDHGDYLVC